jgi:Na+-transporting methylmalonyl-CoA/oxaloacetate decarboxylase gamma subunit
MDRFLKSVIAGNDFGKGIFLMAAGILFVFAVQVLFYILIKAACAVQKRIGAGPPQKAQR